MGALLVCSTSLNRREPRLRGKPSGLHYVVNSLMKWHRLDNDAFAVRVIHSRTCLSHPAINMPRGIKHE